MPQPVSIPGYPIKAGQLACTTAAARLSTPSVSVAAVYLQNDPASSNTVLIGDSNGQYISLAAGGLPVRIDVRDLNQIYAKSSSGTATLNYIAVEMVN